LDKLVDEGEGDNDQNLFWFCFRCFNFL